ncbi:hypothetical protein LIER_25770 [Lithospermum erythrorhizon]|uniref:Uncharacterized protein n=1 Tax=Lithospermum erythrorhizon TaxID=34254 RepID=A0AAV3RBW4_LITER
MAGEVRAKNSPFDDETFRIAYAERKNCFSVQLHRGGELFNGLIETSKFVDVYFVNTDLLLDMEDENGNIKISDWASEFLKTKADERAKLSAERASVCIVEFNLEEEDTDSDSDCDTGDVEETKAKYFPIEENVENEKDQEGSDSHSEYDEESEEDNHESDSDSEYSIEDVMYWKEQNSFDDGELGHNVWTCAKKKAEYEGSRVQQEDKMEEEKMKKSRLSQS